MPKNYKDAITTWEKKDDEKTRLNVNSITRGLDEKTDLVFASKFDVTLHLSSKEQIAQNRAIDHQISKEAVSQLSVECEISVKDIQKGIDTGNWAHLHDNKNFPKLAESLLNYVSNDQQKSDLMAEFTAGMNAPRQKRFITEMGQQAAIKQDDELLKFIFNYAKNSSLFSSNELDSMKKEILGISEQAVEKLMFERAQKEKEGEKEEARKKALDVAKSIFELEKQANILDGIEATEATKRNLLHSKNQENFAYIFSKNEYADLNNNLPKQLEEDYKRLKKKLG